MKQNRDIEELELTASDLEFARSVYQRSAGSPRLTEREVANMRERIERDRRLERRFDALRTDRRPSRPR